MPFLGETAALLTAACWACTSVLFGFAVRRLGAFRMNLIRVVLATALLGGLACLLGGSEWLTAARPRELLLLSLSGLIGLFLGDWAYFESIRLLGPRVGTLFSTLSPPITAWIGVSVLHEYPGWQGFAGMGLTLAGVAWVAMEQPADGTPRGHRIRGAVCGFLGSAGQAVAYVMAKVGMAGGMGPLPATAVRMAGAAVAALVIALFSRRLVASLNPGRDRRVQLAILAATILGPVIGVWLSLVAVQHTQAGIAATLISAIPLFVLPIVVFVQKERVSPRAVLGAVTAVAGVALLFLRGR